MIILFLLSLHAECGKMIIFNSRTLRNIAFFIFNFKETQIFDIK